MTNVPSTPISALIVLGVITASSILGAHAAPDTPASHNNTAISTGEDTKNITDNIEVIEVVANSDPCRPALTHIPAPDVTYQPGVSANGREVAPADLNNSTAPTLPETVSFNILVTPPSDHDDSRLEGTIGRIKTDLAPGGTITILGQTYATTGTATTCDQHRSQ